MKSALVYIYKITYRKSHDKPVQTIFIGAFIGNFFYRQRISSYKTIEYVQKELWKEAEKEARSQDMISPYYP